ncbi:3-oxoacyl-[acyl-carrier-protein] synthase 3 [Tateyamaria omphalii]|uniref:3-oxoacyl-ACP synthase III family protein n=1 Tax=Tateyamaria omphalii TaxID=299262 RepID=UPI0016770A5D|nr:ketoacyl-ACP synthase III [Tateyamaria omphalii]GGX65284.1 3-oxoacyl-[acyl-carrier-protein] synthase 3 [Tateyamaria omphalii]
MSLIEHKSFALTQTCIRVIGTGMDVPENVLTNDDIRTKYNTDLDCAWVNRKLGITERRVSQPDVMTSDLAAAAARNALKQAGISGESIDLLIVATATPDRQAPATACFVQQKAGLHNAISFDVSAVCSGFLYAMTVASSFLRSGQAKRAMVVGADTFSRITDWSRMDAVFFGDGAGAAILEASPQRDAVFDAELYSNGQEADAFTVYPDQTTFSMKAGDVLKAALTAIPQCAERVLARNGLAVEDIDVVVPHQPSINLLQKISEKTGIGFEKFCLNMDRYANTAGATIPIILHESIENGRVKKDDLVFFAAAGAGFTAGAAVLRWN